MKNNPFLPCLHFLQTLSTAVNLLNTWNDKAKLLHIISRSRSVNQLTTANDTANFQRPQTISP